MRLGESLGTDESEAAEAWTSNAVRAAAGKPTGHAKNRAK